MVGHGVVLGSAADKITLTERRRDHIEVFTGTTGAQVATLPEESGKPAREEVAFSLSLEEPQPKGTA